MPFEIITIPFDETQKVFIPEELNKFCANKRVLNKEIKFFTHHQPYWSVFLEYEPMLGSAGKEQASLTEAGRLCYERLREWRRKKAEEEGIPPFVIAKNSHLAEIVQKEIKTHEALKQIEGFGRKKVEKYGNDITEIIKNFYEAAE